MGQLNELSTECGRLYMVPGNHEARWEKAVIGNNAPALWGAVGLSLREQFYGQGLSPDIKWVSESLECEGLYIGKGKTCLVRHGDKQAGRYGIKQVATAALRRDPNISTVVGHHHRLQMMVQTIKDETRKGLTTRNVVGLANPHLSGPHGYVGPSPDWQIGFTVLEFYGASRLRDCTRFTPVPILMDDLGRFCYGGKVYGV